MIPRCKQRGIMLFKKLTSILPVFIISSIFMTCRTSADQFFFGNYERLDGIARDDLSLAGIARFIQYI